VFQHVSNENGDGRLITRIVNDSSRDSSRLDSTMFQNRNREEPEESQEVEEITVIARRLNGAGDLVESLLNVGH